MQLLPQSLFDFANVLPLRRQVRLYVLELLLSGLLLFFGSLSVGLGIHVEFLGVLDEHLGCLLWRPDLMHCPCVLPRDYLRQRKVVFNLRRLCLCLGLLPLLLLVDLLVGCLLLQLLPRGVRLLLVL